MYSNLSPTAQAVAVASDARDAAMLDMYNAECTHRQAEMDAAYTKADAAYEAAKAAHRAACDAWAEANPR